jgi:Ca2+:H+ antiporter
MSKWPGHVEHTLKADMSIPVCFLAIIPLEQTFDFLGEQMKYYLGRSLGDLLIITLNKYGFIIFTHCEHVLIHILAPSKALSPSSS